MLEANFPSLVSKLSVAELKGTTLGIFSCFQFMGIFFGGVISGFINYNFGFNFVILFCILLIIFWCIIILINFKKIIF